MKCLTTSVFLITIGLVAISEQSCRFDLLPTFPIRAIAIIRGVNNNTVTNQLSQIRGSVLFEQTANLGDVRISVNITGFVRQGDHGMHVHSFGINTLSDNPIDMCGSTGTHYNPTASNHGSRSSQVRHIGDLGNIVADANGDASETFVTNGVELCGPFSIIGRTLTIHIGIDDLGLVDSAASRSTGNSGSRIACGMIGYAS